MAADPVRKQMREQMKAIEDGHTNLLTKQLVAPVKTSILRRKENLFLIEVRDWQCALSNYFLVSDDNQTEHKQFQKEFRQITRTMLATGWDPHVYGAQLKKFARARGVKTEEGAQQESLEAQQRESLQFVKSQLSNNNFLNQFLDTFEEPMNAWKLTADITDVSDDNILHEVVTRVKQDAHFARQLYLKLIPQVVHNMGHGAVMEHLADITKHQHPPESNEEGDHTVNALKRKHDSCNGNGDVEDDDDEGGDDGDNGTEDGGMDFESMKNDEDDMAAFADYE